MSSQLSQAVLTRLDELGFDYEVIPCDPELADTAAFCAHYGYPESHSANTIVVASKRPAGRYAACVALATTRLDVNHRVKELMDVKRLSFASPEDTREVTGMEIGGVTPFTLPPNLPLYVDRAVMDLDWAIFGGGDRSCKIKVTPRALERLPSAVVVEDLAG